jgi:rRNA small subunit pseudouridine methyltransferase Nep1
MLNLIITETALEQVPKNIHSHQTVVKHAARLGKKPGNTLLDRSYHHAAMIKLDYHEKRGRPDIAHRALLSALGTPLNRENLLRVFMHTVKEKVIYVNPRTRLPRSYSRFVGLIEQLLIEKEVPRKEPLLLRVEKKDLKTLINELKSQYIVALTRVGKPKTVEKIAESLVKHEDAVVIVGGFPQGRFSQHIIKAATDAFSIDRETLDTSVVISRIIYEYERVLGLPEKRLRENQKDI